MQQLVCKVVLLLAGILLFQASLPANGQEEHRKEPWIGKLKDGTTITRKDLLKILDEHKRWLVSAGKEGKRADLREANLREANLENTDLYEGANLRGANLEGANLLEANLQKAILEGANLQKANLERANLEGAWLVATDLKEAYLMAANLWEANLLATNLQKAELWTANLSFVVFEPKLGSLPDIPSVATAHGLSSIELSI